MLDIFELLCRLLCFTEECDSFWVMRFDPPEFKAMRWNQKVNFLPGMTELCIKSMLHSNIVRMKEKFGEEVNIYIITMLGNIKLIVK
jgi:hypothetical protein